MKLFGDLTPFSPSGLLGLKTDSPLWNSEIKGANFRAGFWGGGHVGIRGRRQEKGGNEVNCRIVLVEWMDVEEEMEKVLGIGEKTQTDGVSTLWSTLCCVC